ncbi:MAG: hypothetical protein OK457_01540 [Thaumarchaeota archaeon]|nr:hypothetical protein [Nitrososphaerota archaeon]
MRFIALVGVIIASLVAGSVVTYILLRGSSPEIVSTTETSFASNFTFSETSALAYFKNLNTTTGLLRDYHNDVQIFLADDQALDYNALKDLYASTRDPSALGLANQINSSISQNYDGMYKYWNPVFTLFGHYPSDSVWNVTTGYNRVFGNDSGYLIEATIFPTNQSHPMELKQYADVAVYYIIWNILVANTTGPSGPNLFNAVGAFNALQTECINYGCQDAGYFSPGVPSNVVYSSYKIALDLIAYKELQATSLFKDINNAYTNETINHLLYVAGQLQAPDGGVYTSYNAYGQNIVPFGLGSYSAENGETTALFELAFHLWSTGHLT